MSSQGLPVTRLVAVDINLGTVAAQAPNLNTCLIVGSSDIIDVSERIRSYASIDAVAADFGTTAPEYLSAALFFGQRPQPNQLYIGRWAENATAGILYGGNLSVAEQAIATWQTITAGNFKISFNGSAATNVVCGSFAAAANLNAVAAIIQTAVRAIGTGGFTNATVVWNGSKFIFTSGTTGTSSVVGAMTAGTANDISGVLKGTAATLSKTVDGIAAETPVAAITILDRTLYWWGLTFAATTPTADQLIAVADYVEAAANKHAFGITSTDAACYDATSTTDIMYRVKEGNYSRTYVQYSANAHAFASWFGRAVTVNFSGNSTVITMMYKTEPSVTAETLTTAQADAIQDKNGNVFVNYNNDTAIIQYGKSGGGYYFDEIQNTDWFAYSIQNAVFNLLYTSTTKIPQTDAGNHLIANVIEGACIQAVNNGTLAPGYWNSNGFGQIKQGDFLPTGYYVYQPPISSQSQADREARKSVAFQVAAKLAGAVQSTDIVVNVNR